MNLKNNDKKIINNILFGYPFIFILFKIISSTLLFNFWKANPFSYSLTSSILFYILVVVFLAYSIIKIIDINKDKENTKQNLKDLSIFYTSLIVMYALGDALPQITLKIYSFSSSFFEFILFLISTISLLISLMLNKKNKINNIFKFYYFGLFLIFVIQVIIVLFNINHSLPLSNWTFPKPYFTSFDSNFIVNFIFFYIPTFLLIYASLFITIIYPMVKIIDSAKNKENKKKNLIDTGIFSVGLIIFSIFVIILEKTTKYFSWFID